MKPHSTGITNCNDPRLPRSPMRVPPSTTFVDSIRVIQMQPIVVCHIAGAGSDWFVVDGKKRLQSVRIASTQPGEDGSVHDGNIEYIYIGVLTAEEAYAYQEQANYHRDENPISSWVAIKEMLFTKGLSWDLTAKTLGIPVSYVKLIEKKMQNVPEWAIAAALDGKISVSTMLSIGKKKQDVQERVKEIFDEESAARNEKPLTLKMVENIAKEFKSVIYAESAQAYALFDMGNLRSTFSRGEIEEIQKLCEVNSDAWTLCEMLLEQKEI